MKRLSSSVAEADACASRHPDPDINKMRQAFMHIQSTLSLSLTFYQLALVADRNDDEHYDASELRDILASLNMVLLQSDHPSQILAKLKGKFDDIREAVEFTILIESLQALYDKGYRFTNADGAAMDHVTGGF